MCCCLSILFRLSSFVLLLKNHIYGFRLGGNSLLFNRNIPDYESILSENDFKRAQQIETYPLMEMITDSDAAMYNSSKFEGDINMNLNASSVGVFLNGALSRNDILLNAVRNRHQLWPKGRIPYAISSQYSSHSRALIAAAMQEYAKYTCIRWVPKTAVDINYIYIQPDIGCYSMVGMAGGRQVVSLGAGCIQKGIIMHELMHAVGFFHEQSRPDRDNFISIQWSNIQPGMYGQFEKYGHGIIQTLSAPYDYASIMHYGPRAFTRNGQPTIIPNQRVRIGQREGFSEIDIEKINRLYRCDDLIPTVTPSPIFTSTTSGRPNITISVVPSTTTTTTTAQSSTTTVSTTQPPVDECVDNRDDCPLLSEQGWCSYSPEWSKEWCQMSCSFCHSTKGTHCEDLRVDCHQLVEARYCKTARQFMKYYCAESCGFCFVTPPTNTAVRPNVVQSTKSITEIIPFVGPESTRRSSTSSTHLSPPYTKSTTDTSTISTICVDSSEYCEIWYRVGFCSGFFETFMKENCPAICGFC
ncbi:hypothetical protein AB6A40_004519 [Gnathostoma spinigerum]|uniref:Metalloendopeptidase n=1 Tax=Gnathostoma spinigerum TaxID=75299 RepID=A0ABD6ECR5_9BILA